MMCSPSTVTCRGLNPTSRQFLGFHSPNIITLFKLTNSSSLRFNSLFLTSSHLTSSISSSFEGSRRTSKVRVNSNYRGGQRDGNAARGKGKSGNKGKENVWSVDNERAKDMVEKEKHKARRRKMGKGRRVTKDKDSNKIMVSGTMLMEVENVLQTEEPVIRPSWNTFASSVSGIWKGVGAVFSPTTAEMEPIDIGTKQENLYDCYTLSRTDMMSVQSGQTLIRRKINWVTLNPFGELKQPAAATKGEHKNGKTHSNMKDITDDRQTKHIVPTFESFDFSTSDVMEEDIMGMEPGLVYFEDGSYSRGPVDIPVGEANDANYYISPTYKFEQCLVKGCHKRLRIVHTIEFSDGGADVQILRVAVYEEQWVGPANIIENSEVELDVKPFSQRKRTRPSELTGSWKVLEMSATPIYGEDDMSSLEENTSSSSSSNGPPFVYLSVETLKKRSLPDNPAYFGEEEMMDMQDVSVLWLPGGVTGYVDISKDGTLCIGVGWYSDEGINLVMERDYGKDGKLKEVRMKTELKRRWTDAAVAAA